ncbi:hypothetical protein HDU76_006617, partial [Blyttiomyces sp. JEL0837]
QQTCITPPSPLHPPSTSTTCTTYPTTLPDLDHITQPHATNTTSPLLKSLNLGLTEYAAFLLILLTFLCLLFPPGILLILLIAWIWRRTKLPCIRNLRNILIGWGIGMQASGGTQNGWNTEVSLVGGVPVTLRVRSNVAAVALVNAWRERFGGGGGGGVGGGSVGGNGVGGDPEEGDGVDGLGGIGVGVGGPGLSMNVIGTGPGWGAWEEIARGK